MVKQVWSNNLITLTTFNFTYFSARSSPHLCCHLAVMCFGISSSAARSLPCTPLVKGFHILACEMAATLFISQFLRIQSMSRDLFSRNKEPRSYLLTLSAILTSRCAAKRSFCLRLCVVLRYTIQGIKLCISWPKIYCDVSVETIVQMMQMLRQR